MLKVREKPLVVDAAQLWFPEGFVVFTKEGVMKGKPGDYLVIGIAGEKYSVDREIFENSYDIIDDSSKKPDRGTGLKKSSKKK